VSSPSYSIEKSHGFPKTLTKRVLLVFLACCIQMIYIPTSNRLIGGIEPKLPIDIFPVSAVWVLPYLMCYLLWSASIAWIIFKAEDRAFRPFIAACILTFAMGTLTFIFFPTYVPPAELAGNDMFTTLLRFTKIGDGMTHYPVDMSISQPCWLCSSVAGIHAKNYYGA